MPTRRCQTCWLSVLYKSLSDVELNQNESRNKYEYLDSFPVFITAGWLLHVILFVLKLSFHHQSILYCWSPLWRMIHPQISSDYFFFQPFEAACLCLSMCLGKTAFCTNWSQWHELQGRVNKLCLHGNPCLQVYPLSCLQCYIGIAVYPYQQRFIETEWVGKISPRHRTGGREALLISACCSLSNLLYLVGRSRCK